ncbi:VCBS repeat-containing protein [Streptomyces sp. NPDC048272]|uniref:FG-GAP repeat domain-containing protein n=1 Tax=Streptomyces sp. NPDC048272 TaxID=3154616 RepID=UPI0034193269
MRISRSGRLAACTATALATGMLMAGTASATGLPKPVTPTPRVTADERVGGHLPAGKPKAATQQKQRLAAGANAAAGSAWNLFDVDGDGADDILYRGLSGTSYLKASGSTEADITYDVWKTDTAEDFKDVIPVGDLDHNGRPDLLRLTVTGRLSLSEAGTSGTGYPAWTGGGWNIYNKVFGAGDLTGDGNADLLARTNDGQLYLYPGTGKAGYDVPFGNRVLLGAGWGAFTQLIGGADYNGDGKTDIVATTAAGVMYFYKGTGSAAAPFGDSVQTGTGWNGFNQIVPLNDSNGQGLVLARTVSGQTYLYAADASGVLGNRFEFSKGWQVSDLISGQGGIPAHGKSSLWGRTGAGTLFTYHTNGDGTFAPRTQISDDAGWPVSEVDVLLTSSLTTTSAADMLYRYQGDLYDGDYLLGGGWGIYNAFAGVGDLTGDGYGDLLARDKSNVLWLYPGKGGNGQGFGNRVKLGAGWGIYNKLIGAGDVTGDGRADLLARGTDGALWAYPGTGTAAAPFGDRVKIGGSGWNGFGKLTAAGDINGDGRTDLVGVDSAGVAYVYSATGEKGLNTFKGRTTLGGGWNTYAELL